MNKLPKLEISIGSETLSRRAREILRREGIFSHVIKIEARADSGGCLYGIEVNKDDAGRAARILGISGIATRVL